MFQRTSQRPESALENSVLAIRRRGAPFHPEICPARVLTALPAEHVLPAGEALAAGNAHGTVRMSRSFDVSRAPRLRLRLAPAAGPGLASTSDLSRRCGWSAWADAGDAVARAV
jgi:hypothetical protein